jgi:hypothetical protein
MKRLYELLSVLLCFAAISYAQEATGRIVGTISDSTGAVLLGVEVTVTNTATQVSRHIRTNNEGYYQALALPIGNYVVSAEHQGFRKVVSTQCKLEINQALRVDIRMEVGAANQTVEVGAQAAPVETVNPTLGQSVTGRELTDMPLNGRDMLDLALLQPGVTESNDDNGGAGNYSIAGGRTDSITYLLDGGQNNDLLDNSRLIDPNPDTVAEFRLLTSDYTAEYGRNAGGIISIVTKSGTNTLHGSAFDFFRNRALDANDFFNIQQGLPRLDLKRNQFGGTLGGPIVKDKLFFFVAYQGQRQVQGIPDVDAPVFTPLQLQGNFSQSGPNGTPDPNVVAFLQANPFFQPNPARAAQAIIAPTQINSVAQAYIKDNLIPTAPGGLLSTTLREVDDRNEITSKFDFVISPKDRLSVTFGFNRAGDPYYGTLNPFPYATVPGFASTNSVNYYFTNIGYTRIVSTNLLNEFHFVTHRSNFLHDSPAATLPTPQSLGIGIIPDQATGPTNLYFDTGLELGESEQGPTRFVENTFSWTDSVTWTRGRHNWKFGAGFTPYQENMVYDYIINGEFDYYTGTPVATGNDYADFLLGAPDAYFQGAKAPSNVRQKNVYVFGQDEWHMKKNLVFTLGLRYEYSTPKSDTEGRTFSIIPGEQSQRFVNAPTGLVFPGDPGAPTGVNFPDKKNFAPRFGFAWDPTGSGKTSLRGGFGLFYDILKAEDNLQFNGQAPFVASAGLFFNDVGPGSGAVNYMSQPFQAAGIPNPFPSTPPPRDVSFASYVPINSNGSVYFVDPHLRTPYVYQYNLSLQHNLIADTVLETNYVGSSSHGLTSLRDINPMILGTTTRVLDQIPLSAGGACGTSIGIFCFGQAPEFQNVANANYNALEASLTREPQPSKLGTVYYTLAYTYGHTLDDASGFAQRNSTVPAYEPHLYYASGDTDVRNRISISGGWDLPFDRAWSDGPKRLTKGWSLYPIFTWRTGFPFDINASLPDVIDPANPGPSGAGDPYLTNAAVVGPIQIFNPDKQRTINEITYGESATGACQITTTPVTGNFYFNPNSFSNVPLENYDYYDGGVPNPCFPQIDPVHNPADRTYGLHRNTLRGPDLVNLDMALAKVTPITERVSLEFRVEYFNSLNHPEFAQPTLLDNATNINSPIFGQITTTGTFRGAAPRIGQIAARLTF